MKLVINTNKIMAAIIKDNLSRQIISTPMFRSSPFEGTVHHPTEIKTAYQEKDSRKGYPILLIFFSMPY